MITEAHIQNFKSVLDLRLPLGQVTVLIGENGCGKSNILEAIAYGVAEKAGKDDREFLVSRGVRVTDDQFMCSAFGEEPSLINIKLKDNDRLLDRLKEIEHELTAPSANIPHAVGLKLERARLRHRLSFLIFSPENSSLRVFEREGQILPLGVKGEGLFKLLKQMGAQEHQDRWEELQEHLQLLDWFGEVRIAQDLAAFEHTLQIRDKYLSEKFAYFDQRSANEGFLFLLFYVALFIGPGTPSFFAIDNIDASLNPKLCAELMRRLSALAKKYNKQVILTTHNPAVLDGLNLHDEEQRLYIIHRNSDGHTRARRARAPQPLGDEPPVKLSEAFLRGILGGLPQNF